MGMPTYAPFSYHFFEIKYKKDTIEHNETTELKPGDLDHFIICFMIRKFFTHVETDDRRNLIK